MTAWRRAIELSIEEEDLGGVDVDCAPAPLVYDIHTSKIAARVPSPALLGKVARSAGWGVARCFDASRIARPSLRTYIDPDLLSTPHPALRATFPASRRRGRLPTAFNSMTCVNAVAHKRGRECRRPSVSLTRATRSARRFLGEVLRLRQECPPETIDTDQNEAYGKAIRALRACFKSSASSLGAFCGTQKASKDAPGGVEQRPLECPSRPLRGASGRGHRLLGQALKQPGELATSVEHGRSNISTTGSRPITAR